MGRRAAGRPVKPQAVTVAVIERTVIPDNMPLLAANVEELRRQAAKLLKGAIEGNPLNLPRLKARAYEEDAVDLLYGLMTDATVDHGTRRACANDILLLSRGRPKPADEDPFTEGEAIPAPEALEAAIMLARRSVERFRQVDRYIGKIDPADWPDELKAMHRASAASPGAGTVIEGAVAKN